MADLQIPTAFTDDELADLARAEAGVLWRKHRKLEMIAGAIAAPVSAFLVGGIMYIFGGVSKGIPYNAIAAAIVAAILGAIITLVFIYGYYRFIEAPSNLYFKTHRELEKARLLLDEEKAKTGDAQISGDILEYSTYPKKKGNVSIQPVIGLYFTVLIEIVNNSPSLTVVKWF